MKSIATALVIAALSTVGATPVAAQDIPSTAIADSVTVDGQITATGYNGSWWWRTRTTESVTFHDSASVPTPSDFVLLNQSSVCAADYAVDSQAFVDRRLDNGWAYVSFIVWTWDRCPAGGRHGAWTQRYAWVAPGESTTINLSTRSQGGGITASATFTNYWTPKIDTSDLVTVVPGAKYDFGF